MGDWLTFYCWAGGTSFDYPYLPQREKESDEALTKKLEENPDIFNYLACQSELPVGDTVDKLKNLSIITIVKLERISSLIYEETKKIQEMTELVSQCNKENCSVSCNCIPNPCFGCCSPFPCGICALGWICRIHCLQGVGVCSGDPCPREDIEEKANEIKETQDKILKTVQDIKNIFPQVNLFLKGKMKDDDTKYYQFNLESLSGSVQRCAGSDVENQEWILLSCEEAKGEYGPGGQKIRNCNPGSFYCCSFSPTPVKETPPDIARENKLTYLIPAKKYPILPVDKKNGCPKGWSCDEEANNYNQYKNGAALELKQLLACMRKDLDSVQERENLNEIIGKIHSISDPKIYQDKTCDWESGPRDGQTENCTYVYDINHQRETISAHYGGKVCRYQEKSYAVDFNVSEDFQKAHVEEIIKAAKKCAPAAYTIYSPPYLHIDIGNIVGCKSCDY